MNLERLVEEFNRYHSKTNEVIEILKELDEEKELLFLDKNNLLYQIEVLQGLKEKLKNPNIVISVVAEVANGKSTFLNSLIFRDVVLDSSIGATTATIFKIQYGEKYKISGFNYEKELETIEELKKEAKEYNQKIREKIQNEEKVEIKEVVLELPHEELKKGIILYDTPGFGALDEDEIFEILKKAISVSDAVIILLDISKGLKKGEKEFIETTLKSITPNKRYVALNKIDAIISEDQRELLSEEEIDSQIKNVIDNTLKELSKLGDIPIDEIKHYEISAQKALVGYKKNNEEKLKESNFEKFEKDLWSNLIKQKEEVFNDRIELFNDVTTNLNNNFENSLNKINATKEEISSLKDNIIHQTKKLETVLGETKARLKSIREEILYKNKKFNLEDLYFILKNSIQKELEEHFENKITQFDRIKNLFNYSDLYLKETKNFLKTFEEKLTTLIDDKVESFIDKFYITQIELNSILKDTNAELKKFDIKEIEDIEVITKNDEKFDISMDIGEKSLKKIILGGIDENNTFEVIREFLRKLFTNSENLHNELSKEIAKNLIENIKKNVEDKMKIQVYKLEELGENINKKTIEIEARFNLIMETLENPQELETQIQNLNNQLEVITNYKEKLQGVLNG